MQNHAVSPTPAVFCFESHEVRTFEQLGSVFFNVNDICKALTFKNPSQAISSHVDTEDLQKLETPSPSGSQLANYVNESGMYSLVMGSTKPEAKRFKKWVTSEVLPSIRKTGSYSVAPLQAPALPTDPLQLLIMCTDVLRDQDARVKHVEEQVAQIEANTRLHDWQRYELREAVNRKVDELQGGSTPSRYRRVLSFVKRHFRVATYASIPASRYEEARTIVDNVTGDQLGGATA